MDKCNKYEALYTFGNEEMLKKHIAKCKYCKEEQQEQDKISELLKEVKPYYVAKRKNTAKLKAACALFLIMLC